MTDSAALLLGYAFVWADSSTLQAPPAEESVRIGLKMVSPVQDGPIPTSDG